MGTKPETHEEFSSFDEFLDWSLAEDRMRRRDTRPVALLGSMEAILFKADGRVSVTRRDNLIVNAGWTFISDAIGAASGRPAVMSHIGVGTGTTAAAVTQTDLVTPTLRKAATFSKPATKQFQFETTFNPGEATAALTEAGVFNAAAAGIMLDRVTFSVINKGADDTLTQRFTFTMS